MGVDIHMFIKNSVGGIGAENVYDGRNSEWFNNLQGNGWDDCYDELPRTWNAPDAVKFDEAALHKQGYYGFNYVNVAEFVEWFEKYKPDVDAGWVTTYEKWKIENKGFEPEELMHYLPDDANINDYHFIEYKNPYDCSRYVYDFIHDRFHEDDFADLWICYYFDY